MIATAEAPIEVCKHNVALGECAKCKKAAYDAIRRSSVKKVEPIEDAFLDVPGGASVYLGDEPIAEVAVEPIAVEAVSEPVAEVIAKDSAIVQIFNVDGLQFEMLAGPGASSECRHRELATLLPHVAVSVGTSNGTIADLLKAREAKMLARPKIARLLAAKAKA